MVWLIPYYLVPSLTKNHKHVEFNTRKMLPRFNTDKFNFRENILTFRKNNGPYPPVIEHSNAKSTIYRCFFPGTPFTTDKPVCDIRFWIHLVSCWLLYPPKLSNHDSTHSRRFIFHKHVFLHLQWRIYRTVSFCGKSDMVFLGFNFWQSRFKMIWTYLGLCQNSGMDRPAVI